MVSILISFIFTIKSKHLVKHTVRFSLTYLTHFADQKIVWNKKSLEKQWISRLVQQVTNNSSNCDMKIKYTLHAYNHCKKVFELK